MRSNSPTQSQSFFFYATFIPFLLLILFAPWSAYYDLNVSHFFYRAHEFRSDIFLLWIYHYGIIPGWIFTGIAACGLIFSFLNHNLKKWRNAYLLIILTLALGSGLFIHLIFKDHWGRPRPRQVTEFGGSQNFKPFFLPSKQNLTESSKSFACGHCTMGFCFFSLIFLGHYYKQKKLMWMGIIFSFLIGGALGYARIAQGGHFLSDVLVSALIMWWTALFLYRYLFFQNFCTNLNK